MAVLTWLPEAVGALERLLLLLHDKNPEAARRAAHTVARAADRLVEGCIGRPLADGTARRELVVPFAGAAFGLRYRVEETGAVVVLRVWHGEEERA
ncbi:plasmid stabilization protein [Pseudoroseomonas rhizosphaerae]|uniref:Plasmid stabilization protein n=1 Tax=Teichococcus rhizosphaerae TaxID=1335062 RepID=A0A2C7A5B8_9PROT|nr:type II toxin-antitoxin system RelE/ParE family toxin [Pseudoroseomonas rhizosphaerae]PHK95278.1 plasmid stabilization protein [Pseudoroseomonas rhizosphaerae]